MNPFAIAFVLVYGALSVVAALVAATIASSVLGAALAFAGAGLIYIFQIMDVLGLLENRTPTAIVWALGPAALLLSVSVSLWS